MMIGSRDLSHNIKYWLIPVLVLWIATFIDFGVTLITGKPSLEYNPLVQFLMSNGFSFGASMLIILIPFTVLQSGIIVKLWKSRYDVFALTFAIGLSVAHLIGAMSWIPSPFLRLEVPLVACIVVGFLLDLLDVEIIVRD